MKTLFEESRGIKGRIKHRFCAHGKWILKDYKETGDCSECTQTSVEAFSIPNTNPFFNAGLGQVTNGTRDAERIAKKRGLMPIGREPIKGAAWA